MFSLGMFVRLPGPELVFRMRRQPKYDSTFWNRELAPRIGDPKEPRAPAVHLIGKIITLVEELTPPPAGTQQLSLTTDPF